MIRILLVDDHPALRAGLFAVLRAEPGLVPLGTASDESELWPKLTSTRPDVVLLDYHLPGRDGLALCHEIKSRLLAPRVLLYSAYADSAFAVPAILAGADGLVNKSAPALELFEALRKVAAGERVLPALASEHMRAAARKVDEEDQPIFGMLIEGASEGEVAETLRLSRDDVSRRVARMIRELRLEVPLVHS